MLNEKTRTILEKLSSINNSMILSYPKTGIALGKSIQAFIDMNKFDEQSFDEIGVWSISELNSIINVIEDAKVTLDNGFLEISNGKSSIKYGTTDISIIESECRVDPSLPDRIKNNEQVLEFTLTSKEVNNIKKMSSLLKELSDLEFTSKDNSLNITTKSTEKSSNNYNISKEAEGEDLSIILNMDIVNKVPSLDYKVSVYRSSKGSLVALFESTTVEGIEIIIAPKA